MNSLSPDPLHGLDPESLMSAAAIPTDAADAADAETIRLAPRDLPTLEAISAAFPDLEVLELIGHGGMSAVFRARQPKLDRVVALKVLPKSLAATPGFAERFTREGRVLARLNHPNIVTVHDFGESGGFCFLIMEHVDGVNLRQAMRAGRFTPEQALKIIPAICDALQFAHSQGVLHRDIKPENILLDASGKVKIADFGIAKILDDKVGDSMLLTQSGAKLGTAPYMAPEQIEKPSSVDHRADIYSLGVVFYEMLTGELPLGRFGAPSEFASVSDRIDEIVFRALEKERTRRQQSADEFKTQVQGAGSAKPPTKRRKFDLNEPFEYKSKRQLCGLPLLHVVSGSDPETGKAREAHGFFAMGGRARGVFAAGGTARGWVAFGGLAYGLIAIGGIGVGLISISGLALGLLLACGGLSIGALSIGGLALGYHACGGLVVAWHGIGGQVFAHQGFGGRVFADEIVKDVTQMHPLTAWLGSLMPWMSMLWLPYFPIYGLFCLVFWWAQRQAMVEAGELPREAASKRIFWLVPAIVAACGVVWIAANGMWVLLTEKPPLMDSPTVCFIALVVMCTGLMMFIAAVPLWLRLVPMNRLYGIRLQSTMTSDERWFDANAVFGRKLFEGSIGVIIAGIAGFHQLPRHQDSYPWAVVAFTLSTVAYVVVTSLWWLHHHPVDGPVKKESKLTKFSGQAVIAVLVAFFIKGFIFEPYRIPIGSEPGVIKGSHWIASKLDTSIAPPDLVVYKHDNGQNWIARVVERQPHGLLLKRATTPDPYFVPWNRIVGEMLFAHFSPNALKQAGGPYTELTRNWLSGKASNKPTRPEPSIPVTEGSERAPNAKATLSFMRIAMNEKRWPDAFFDPAGKPVPMTTEISKAVAVMSSRGSNDKPNSCWLEVWVNHPDFEPSSDLSVHLLDANLEPLKGSGTISRNISIQAGLHGYLCMAICAGDRKDLPQRCTIKVRYSFGRWDQGTRVNPNNNTSISTSDWILGSIGESGGEGTFVSWGKQNLDRQVQCLAHLKDGTVLAGSAGITSSGGLALERARFDAKLAEIDHFTIRSRDYREIIVKDVVLPPFFETNEPAKEAAAPNKKPATPPSEGTSNALDRKPALRFLRMKRHDTEWKPRLYLPDGKVVDHEATTRMVSSLVRSGMSSDNPDDCWLQLWFEHPDFDSLSYFKVDMTDANGNALSDRDESTSSPGWPPDEAAPPVCDYVLSPGRVGKLPSVVNLTLHYGIGPWSPGSKVKPDYAGSIVFGTGCILAGFGDGPDHRAFLSWSKEKDDGVQYDAIAWLTSGKPVGFTGRSGSGSGQTLLERVKFPASMREIISFDMRSRKLKTVEFKNVVIPPLP